MIAPILVTLIALGQVPPPVAKARPPAKKAQAVAAGLASRGIAVLRFDTRTKVHGPKMASSDITVKG